MTPQCLIVINDQSEYNTKFKSTNQDTAKLTTTEKLQEEIFPRSCQEW